MEDTKNWVKKFIIGENICPFAGHSYENNTLGFVEINDADFETLLGKLWNEILNLNTVSNKDVSNVLCLVPALSDWNDFLDIMDILEQLIEDQDYTELIQVVGFHPNYIFEDSEDDDPANYTNRSPQPMVHLLRVDEVAKAIKNFVGVEHIPTRNIEKLREMGLEGIKKLLI
jgi:hypothetical protein